MKTTKTKGQDKSTTAQDELKTYYIVMEAFGRYDTEFKKFSIKAKNIYEALAKIIPVDDEDDKETDVAKKYLTTVGTFDFAKAKHSGAYYDEEHSVGFGESHTQACEQYIRLRMKMD